MENQKYLIAKISINPANIPPSGDLGGWPFFSIHQ